MASDRTKTCNTRGGERDRRQRSMRRRLLRPTFASAAAIGAASAASRVLATTNEKASDGSSQAVAAHYVERLATSDGQKYTLQYLDKSKRFSVWRGDGERATFSEMLGAAEKQNIVIIGETHYDAIGHKLQEVVFARLAALRPITLALEMFETDVQHVLDEYLSGLIREQDMLKDARPWANYSDYRPMVELSKAAGFPVVAANAPRRYVSAAGRVDDATFASSAWSLRARADLPPLPLPEPSAAYTAFLMADPEVVPSDAAKQPGRGGCPHIGLTSAQGLVGPMRLWDACMAHSIARARQTAPSHLVIHLCGSDHRVGVLDYLKAYAPSERPLVITLCPEADCHRFVRDRHLGAGDFVVLTDASASKAPTSHAQAGALPSMSAQPMPSPMPPPPPAPPAPQPPAAAPPQTSASSLAAAAAALPQPSSARAYQLHDFAEPCEAQTRPPSPPRASGNGMVAQAPPASQRSSIANNSLSRAIFVLQEAAAQAALSGLATVSLIYAAIRVAERVHFPFSTSFRRRGRLGLPMGGGLIVACIGAKYGVHDAIVKLDQMAQDGERIN